MLKHYYSQDYLEHLAKFTNSEINTFMVDDYFINFFVKHGPFGKVINSSPFYGSHGGFFFDNKLMKSSYKKFSMNELVEWLIQDDVASLTIVENPFGSKGETSKNNKLIKILREKHAINYEIIKRFSYIKRIEGVRNLNDLLKSYHSKTRNCVRKYLKSGANIKNYDMRSPLFKNMISWLGLEHKKEILSKNGLAKPQSYFEGLKDNYKTERLDLKICYLNDEPVGGLLNFKIENQVEYWTPVVTSLGRTINSVYGLVHNTLKDIINKKNSFLNFGGCWLSQKDLQRFKQRFGTEINEYNYHCFVYSKIIIQKSSIDLLKSYPFFFIRNF